MSAIGLPPENPTPQLPGTINITPPQVQPGNSGSSKPNITASNPPNVDGGSANFSDVTQSISDLISAKKAELSSSQDALLANTAVDKSVSQAVSGYQSQTLKAMDNIKKTQSLPGGATGGIARIISLFNDDYNVNLQKTTIDENQIKASQVSATGAAIKEQNNQLPLFLSKISEAQNVIFQAQKDANQLALQKQTLTDTQMKTKIDAARLKLEMNSDARAQAEFNIRKLSTEQIQAELPRAQAGKGPFAGMAGLLQDRLTSETMAETSLATAQNALAKGNRDEYNSSLTDAVSHMPADFVAGKMLEAQKSGSPMVSFNIGTGKDGKPQTLDVPFNLVQTALVTNLGTQKQVNEALAADYTQRLNLIPNATNLMNTANSMASLDPRATQIIANLEPVMRNLNAKDPNSVRQTGLALQGFKTQMDEIVKEQANKMGTPEAKAAVISYGNTGKFDTNGGTAVVVDSVGIPSLTSNSLYKNAWAKLSILVASQIASEHLTGSGVNIPTAGTGNTSDALSLIAQLMAKPQGKESLRTITAEVLADPNKMTEVRNALKGTIQGSSIMNVIGQLSQQKNATPFWNSLMEHPEQFKTNGQPDISKLFSAMEQQSVLSGLKVNYADTFLNGLRNYAINSDTTSSTDPRYIMQDRAQEAAIFGGAPHQAVLGDLHWQLRQIANRAHAEMMARVKQDLNGQTSTEAMKQNAMAMGMNENINGMSLMEAQQYMRQKADFNPDNVPSATGTGMTVGQIKALYGAGIR